MAERLAAQRVAALRPDPTDPDPAASASALEALATGLAAEVGADRVVLVGYSWGSVVTSLAAPPGLAARVLVAPPAAMFDVVAEDDLPRLVLVPAHDQFGGPEAVEAMERLAGHDHRGRRRLRDHFLMERGRPHRRPCRGLADLVAVEGALQLGDVQLHHAEHRLRGPGHGLQCRRVEHLLSSARGRPATRSRTCP